MPMRVLDEKILENFQLECLQDLKMDVAGDFREDKNLQGRLLPFFMLIIVISRLITRVWMNCGPA